MISTKQLYKILTGMSLFASGASFAGQTLADFNPTPPDVAPSSPRGCSHASDANEIVSGLEGSAWSGELRAFGPGHLHLGSGDIRIAFLPSPSVNGGLQYFHKLEDAKSFLPVAPELVELIDQACKFTPRSMRLNSNVSEGPVTGALSIYPCAPNEISETKLENEANRPTKKQVRISAISLSEDKNTLRIEASLLNGGIKVVYELTRQTDVPSTPDALESWALNAGSPTQ